MKECRYHWTAEKRARVNRLSAREKRRKYISQSSITSLKTFDYCKKQPHEIVRLAIATVRSYKLACTEQPHVRTQLAIATTEQPYVRLNTVSYTHLTLPTTPYV